MGAVLGFAFALNDRLSYSTALQGAYSPSSQFGDDELQSSESYSLRFALTSLLTEQLSLEPSVAFSLNEGSAVTLGLSIPYRFSF